MVLTVETDPYVKMGIIYKFKGWETIQDERFHQDPIDFLDKSVLYCLHRNGEIVCCALFVDFVDTECTLHYLTNGSITFFRVLKPFIEVIELIGSLGVNSIVAYLRKEQSSLIKFMKLFGARLESDDDYRVYKMNINKEKDYGRRKQAKATTTATTTSCPSTG